MNERLNTFKIVLLGDGGVGKTSLRKRFLGEGFKSQYAMTIGADFAVKKIQIEGVEYRAQIWDLSGQVQFNEVRKLYYRNCAGIVLVFDLTQQSSFENIPNWIKEYLDSAERGMPSAVLLGNKSDLWTEDQLNEFHSIARDYAKELSNSLNSTVKFFFTSALSGKNVDRAFTTLFRAILSLGDDW